MAISGLKRHLGLTSAQGQEADIAVLTIDPHFQVYGKHWFSVQAVACMEIISFPYTPTDLDPAGPRISLNQGQTAGIRKRVPFRTARLGR